ncbi:MAG: XRE family transcriptional regulator [Oscillospiraceae bacterium]|nr:XRE family transcriptional regulator [Oscillospiraceae bacterium]
MRKELSDTDVISHIGALAFGKANDAVKLVFLDPQEKDQIRKLDLGMVSEIKRGANGAVEVKLIDRIALLELLAHLTAPQASKGGEAESFFTAMDKAAAKLGAVDS